MFGLPTEVEEDITNLIFTTASNMPIGQIICDESSYESEIPLQALIIMDSKMDPESVVSSPIPTVSQILAQKDVFLPDALSSRDLLRLLDTVVSLEGGFRKGASIIAALYSCFYFHQLDHVVNPLLKGFLLASIKTSVLSYMNIVHAHVFDADFFTKIPNFGGMNVYHKVPLDDVIALLEQGETYLEAIIHEAGSDLAPAVPAVRSTSKPVKGGKVVQVKPLSPSSEVFTAEETATLAPLFTGLSSLHTVAHARSLLYRLRHRKHALLTVWALTYTNAGVNVSPAMRDGTPKHSYLGLPLAVAAGTLAVLNANYTTLTVTDPSLLSGERDVLLDLVPSHKVFFSADPPRVGEHATVNPIVPPFVLADDHVYPGADSLLLADDPPTFISGVGPIPAVGVFPYLGCSVGNLTYNRLIDFPSPYAALCSFTRDIAHLSSLSAALYNALPRNKTGILPTRACVSHSTNDYLAPLAGTSIVASTVSPVAPVFVDSAGRSVDLDYCNISLQERETDIRRALADKQPSVASKPKGKGKSASKAKTPSTLSSDPSLLSLPVNDLPPATVQSWSVSLMPRDAPSAISEMSVAHRLLYIAYSLDALHPSLLTRSLVYNLYSDPDMFLGLGSVSILVEQYLTQTSPSLTGHVESPSTQSLVVHALRERLDRTHDLKHAEERKKTKQEAVDIKKDAKYKSHIQYFGKLFADTRTQFLDLNSPPNYLQTQAQYYIPVFVNVLTMPLYKDLGRLPSMSSYFLSAFSGTFETDTLIRQYLTAYNVIDDWEDAIALLSYKHSSGLDLLTPPKHNPFWTAALDLALTAVEYRLISMLRCRTVAAPELPFFLSFFRTVTHLKYTNASLARTPSLQHGTAGTGPALAPSPLHPLSELSYSNAAVTSDPSFSLAVSASSTGYSLCRTSTPPLSDKPKPKTIKSVSKVADKALEMRVAERLQEAKSKMTGATLDYPYDSVQSYSDLERVAWLYAPPSQYPRAHTRLSGAPLTKKQADVYISSQIPPQTVLNRTPPRPALPPLTVLSQLYSMVSDALVNFSHAAHLVGVKSSTFYPATTRSQTLPTDLFDVYLAKRVGCMRGLLPSSIIDPSALSSEGQHSPRALHSLSPTDLFRKIYNQCAAVRDLVRTPLCDSQRDSIDRRTPYNDYSGTLGAPLAPVVCVNRGQFTSTVSSIIDYTSTASGVLVTSPHSPLSASSVAPTSPTSTSPEYSPLYLDFLTSLEIPKSDVANYTFSPSLSVPPNSLLPLTPRSNTAFTSTPVFLANNSVMIQHVPSLWSSADNEAHLLAVYAQRLQHSVLQLAALHFDRLSSLSRLPLPPAADPHLHSTLSLAASKGVTAGSSLRDLITQCKSERGLCKSELGLVAVSKTHSDDVPLHRHMVEEGLDHLTRAELALHTPPYGPAPGKTQDSVVVRRFRRGSPSLTPTPTNTESTWKLEFHYDLNDIFPTPYIRI